MSSLEKCLFRRFAHFSIGLFAFLLLSCMSYLYVSEILQIYLLDMWFVNVFSHSVGCLFNVFIVSFSVQKLFK